MGPDIAQETQRRRVAHQPRSETAYVSDSPGLHTSDLPEIPAPPPRSPQARPQRHAVNAKSKSGPPIRRDRESEESFCQSDRRQGIGSRSETQGESRCRVERFELRGVEESHALEKAVFR